MTVNLKVSSRGVLNTVRDQQGGGDFEPTAAIDVIGIVSSKTTPVHYGGIVIYADDGPRIAREIVEQWNAPR